MTKLALVIFVTVTLQLIYGTLARPDNFKLSEEQITRLRALATQWKRAINLEKNPCEEFYDFVCSNKQFPKPKKKNADELLKSTLNAKPELMTETEEKYLKYSTTCEEFKPEKKEDFIKWFKFDNSIGNWPAFEEKWDDNKFNLPLAIAEMNSYDYPVVFNHGFIFDTTDEFKTSLQINRQDLLNTEHHKELFKTKFQKLGVKNHREVLHDAALFEKTYNEAAESQKSSADMKIKFSELKDYLPEVDCDKQMEIMYGEIPSDDYPVVVKSYEELKEIYRAISKLSPKVIANYFFCAFVYNVNDISYSRAHLFFMPVVKQAFMKHVFDQNIKDMLKSMYITVFEILQDQNILHDFKIHYSSELIEKFISEDIFGLTSEDDLAKEFKEVSTNTSECIKNYHHLQRIYKKTSTKPFFSSKNAFAAIMKSEITNDLVYYIPEFIDHPSPFIFEPIIFSLIPSVIDNTPNTTIFSSATSECFAKQFTKVTNDDLKIMLAAQLILKSFAVWTKNYPDVVQEENKILKEYDLSAEKLLVISIEKYTCEKMRIFNMVMNAYANSMEFPQIFVCPVGSTLNADKKCSFW